MLCLCIWVVLSLVLCVLLAVCSVVKSVVQECRKFPSKRSHYGIRNPSIVGLYIWMLSQKKTLSKFKLSLVLFATSSSTGIQRVTPPPNPKVCLGICYPDIFYPVARLTLMLVVIPCCCIYHSALRLLWDSLFLVISDFLVCP
jgi:hypothetical protein